MGFSCGIVGLPNVGKSTLFSALTETAAAQAENYPFCTIEPNLGEVAVPDSRLEPIAALAKSAAVVPTRLAFVDIADLDSLERRVEPLEKRARGGDVEAGATLDLVRRALSALREGKPARVIERKDEEQKAFRMLGLLTSKPVLYVCNVDEEHASDGNEFSRAVELRAQAEGAGCVLISAKIEAEIAVLSPADRGEYLAAHGLHEAGLDRLIRAGYALLDLLTFFTAGPKETHAWTVTRGTRAQQAAGVIHTDFERGFIRAEVVSYEEYVALGGEAGARDAGKLRLEGKDYVVADGDVIHFRFAT